MIIRIPFLKAILPTFVLGILIIGCGGNDGGHEGDTVKTDTIVEPTNPNKGNIVNVGNQLFSIPSPVQTSLLIRELGLGVTPDITNPTDNLSKYSSKVQKALNMGVYGADLGYMTVFNNSQGALDYLKAVQTLADELEVSNAFDADLIRRFNNAMGNEDSLLVIAGEAFRASDAYLKDNERDEVAALVLAGGWVESFYFSIMSVGDTPDAALMKRIAEQRTPLKNLIALLYSIDEHNECTELISQLKELQAAFAQVSTVYHFEQPTVVVEEKTTYINSSTEVLIGEEHLNTISAKLTAIRNSITE